MGVQRYFLKKMEPLYPELNESKSKLNENLMKESKQRPVVILQPAVLYNIFTSCLWLLIIRRLDQGV